MVAKYAGVCACCGAPIKAGEWVTYYPSGTMRDPARSAIAHVGGLDGNSARCTVEIRKREFPVVPGCERTALQAQAARDQQGRGMMRHKKPQREPGPLFESRDTKQMSLF